MEVDTPIPDDEVLRHRAAQSRYRKSAKGGATQRRWRKARTEKMFRARLTAGRKARSAAALRALLGPARAITADEIERADW